MHSAATAKWRCDNRMTGASADKPQEMLQSEIGRAVDPGAGVEGTGIIALAAPPDENVPPPPFVPVEKYPEVVVRVRPIYPPLAIMAGLGGRVSVRLWVDATGHVRDAVIERGDIDLFNDAALAAAWQFVFTPAIMNDRPVAVWVSIPFTFSLWHLQVPTH